MNKIYYQWDQIQSITETVIQQIKDDSWIPDYVIGLTRGGLIPAVVMSHAFGIKMHTLHVQLLDGDISECESNLWMAEDACPAKSTKRVSKNLLIVDDINDTGTTINWIKNDWQRSILVDNATWNEVWGKNIRIATLINNVASKAISNYAGVQINKDTTPSWIVFPWESDE